MQWTHLPGQASASAVPPWRELVVQKEAIRGQQTRAPPGRDLI